MSKLSAAAKIHRAQELIRMGVITSAQEYLAALGDLPNRRLMTVDHWLSVPHISDNEVLLFPNAKIAAEMKSSPLYEALS